MDFVIWAASVGWMIVDSVVNVQCYMICVV